MFNTKGSGVKKGGLVAAAVMTIALPFTAQHEGLRMKAYLDPVGIPTICYGETKGVELGQVKSRQECDDMLAVRLAWFGYQVDQLVDVPLNACQHAALSSMSYNIGLSAFKNSTLLRKLNGGDYDGAAKQFDRWVYAKGRKLPGLIERRKQERKLFENECRKVQGMQTDI